MSGVSTVDAARAGRVGVKDPTPVRTRRKPPSPTTAVTYLVMVVVIALTAVPVLFAVLGGFRNNAQLNSSPAGWPSPWVFGNFREVLTSAVFWRALLNSTVIATIATALTVGLGSMVGFALSRYSFPGRESLYVLFVVGLLFPVTSASLPLYLLVRQIGLLDNPLGVALPQAAFSLPFTIVILRPFMRAIPSELEDAAVVDGTTRLGFFWRIMLPLSRPALVTVAVLAFVTSWNAFLLPLLVFSDPNNFTLPLAVASFQSQYTQDVARILAYTTMSMVPALAFFLVVERQIVGGLTGSIKG